jgi:hypothetical protein
LVDAKKSVRGQSLLECAQCDEVGIGMRSVEDVMG